MKHKKSNAQILQEYFHYHIASWRIFIGSSFLTILLIASLWQGWLYDWVVYVLVISASTAIVSVVVNITMAHQLFKVIIPVASKVSKLIEDNEANQPDKVEVEPGQQVVVKAVENQ